MIELQVQLQNRDFSLRQADIPARLRPERYSFSSIGGPERATISLHGGPSALWEALEYLRCPVEIYDARGALCWWGYVAEAQVSVGAVSVSVSLDQMANRIAVAYSELAPGSSSAGVRDTTAYYEDATSTLEYGDKELILTANGVEQADAESYAQRALADRKYPVPIVQVRGDAGGEPSATLTCRGWWDTLGWLYYTNTDTADTVTTLQISGIFTNILTRNAWFGLCTIVDASGIPTNELKDGDRTAKQEIEDLLDLGTSGHKRLLASVTATSGVTNRKCDVRIYQEPTSNPATDYYLSADGRLWTAVGAPVDLHTCPVGFWCHLRDVIPDTVDLSRLASPTPFFLDWAEYNVRTGKLTPRSRNARNPYTVGEVQPG